MTQRNCRFHRVVSLVAGMAPCCGCPTAVEKASTWSDPILLAGRDSTTYVTKLRDYQNPTNRSTLYTTFGMLYLDNYCVGYQWDSPGFHPGVDISAPEGTTVYAVTDGEIVTVGYTNAWGNFLVIRHKDVAVYSQTANVSPKTTFYSIYAHLRTAGSFGTYEGKNVKTGDPIGLVGNMGTGEHLHFQLDRQMPRWGNSGIEPFWPKGSDATTLRTPTTKCDDRGGYPGNDNNSVATTQAQQKLVIDATWDPMRTINNRGPTQGEPDLDLLLRNVAQQSNQQLGTACSENANCSSGFCASGVCCDKPCQGACEACNLSGRAGLCSANDGVRCNDGNACTTRDTCSAGACVGGSPLDCNDGSTGTDDGCAPTTGCFHTPNANACDDGNACTTGDAISGGTCVGGPPLNCDDGNACTDDSCIPVAGCVHIATSANSCDDGNACTAGDTCVTGVCTSGPLLSCDDNNACTKDHCEPTAGCSHDALGTRTLCDDGDSCTENDFCLEGVCQSGEGPVIQAQVEFRPNPNAFMRAKYCKQSCGGGCSNYDNYPAVPCEATVSPVYSILTYDPSSRSFVPHNDNLFTVTCDYYNPNIPLSVWEANGWGTADLLGICSTSLQYFDLSSTVRLGAPFVEVVQIGGYGRSSIRGIYGENIVGTFQIRAAENTVPTCGDTLPLGL